MIHFLPYHNKVYYTSWLRLAERYFLHDVWTVQ